MTAASQPQDVDRFATRQASAIDAERRAGVSDAFALILKGRPDRALYELARSVERQVRMAGAGSHPIEPLCPCRGRCDHGKAVSS